MEEKRSALQTALKEREAALVSTGADLQSKTEECDGLLKSITSLEQEKESLSKEIAIGVSKCNELEGDVAKLETDLKERGDISDAELKDLREEVSTLSATLADVRRELAENAAKLKM